jgi:hypothetical protein
MRDGKHCPSCGKDIGVWPVLTAALPNLVRCPHCKARLAYRGILGLMIFLSVLAAALLAAFLYAAQELGLSRTQRILAFIAIVVALWVPMELAVTFYLRSSKELVRKDAK